jgi:hypothetical protein
LLNGRWWLWGASLWTFTSRLCSPCSDAKQRLEVPLLQYVWNEGQHWLLLLLEEIERKFTDALESPAPTR